MYEYKNMGLKREGEGGGEREITSKHTHIHLKHDVQKTPKPSKLVCGAFSRQLLPRS